MNEAQAQSMGSMLGVSQAEAGATPSPAPQRAYPGAAHLPVPIPLQPEQAPRWAPRPVPASHTSPLPPIALSNLAPHLQSSPSPTPTSAYQLALHKLEELFAGASMDPQLLHRALCAAGGDVEAATQILLDQIADGTSNAAPPTPPPARPPERYQPLTSSSPHSQQHVTPPGGASGYSPLMHDRRVRTAHEDQLAVLKLIPMDLLRDADLPLDLRQQLEQWHAQQPSLSAASSRGAGAYDAEDALAAIPAEFLADAVLPDELRARIEQMNGSGSSNTLPVAHRSDIRMGHNNQGCVGGTGRDSFSGDGDGGWTPAVDNMSVTNDKLAQLRIYFMNETEAELLLALEASNGDTFGAIDLLLQLQQDECLLQQSQIDADAKYAQTLGHGDGARMGGVSGVGSQSSGNAVAGRLSAASIIRPSPESYAAQRPNTVADFDVRSPIGELLGAFPDAPSELLTDVLQECGGSLPKARAQLLTWGMVEVKQAFPAGGLLALGLEHGRTSMPQHAASTPLSSAASRNYALNSVPAPSRHMSSPMAPAGHEQSDGDGDASEDEELAAAKAAGTVTRDMVHAATQRAYDKHRKAAIQLKEAQDVLFQASRDAFAAGDRQQAKFLSQEARELTPKLNLAHAKAAQKIYNKRQDFVINTWSVDLHGMHEAEALDRVKSTIDQFRSLPSKKVIRIITGRGNHSVDGAPRLLLAVRQWLQDHGHNFIEKVGYFNVYLDPQPTA